MNIFSWNDLNPTAREYILMAKDVRDMQYRKQWPTPGGKTLIELVANENKALKFYLDLTENKRSSSLILGLSADRKSTMQTRVSDRPLIRLVIVIIPRSFVTEIQTDRWSLVLMSILI